MSTLEGSAFIRFQSLSQMEFAFTAAVNFRQRPARYGSLVHIITSSALFSKRLKTKSIPGKRCGNTQVLPVKYEHHLHI
jgi:hypothetical protein